MTHFKKCLGDAMAKWQITCAALGLSHEYSIFAQISKCTSSEKKKQSIQFVSYFLNYKCIGICSLHQHLFMIS